MLTGSEHVVGLRKDPLELSIERGTSDYMEWHVHRDIYEYLIWFNIHKFEEFIKLRELI